MIMIGALLELNLLPLGPSEFREILAKNFSAQRLKTNLQALEEGKKIITA
jgi:Pyruvate/2-oxoacid:ferredoxin oxidoreductase gamma subunit